MIKKKKEISMIIPDKKLNVPPLISETRQG